LALALAQHDGWQLAVINGDGHAFAVRGNVALDIKGPRPIRQLLAEWHGGGFGVLDDLHEARNYFYSWGRYSERIQWGQAGHVAAELIKLVPPS